MDEKGSEKGVVDKESGPGRPCSRLPSKLN